MPIHDEQFAGHLARIDGRNATGSSEHAAVLLWDDGAMLTLGTTVLGVDDFQRAKRFWMEALGYVPRDAGDVDFVVLVPPDGNGPHLALDVSETPVQEHPRVHLDLYADDQAAEVERLLGLGATDVDWDLYPDRPHDFVVLADTEGNRFCVIDAHFSPTDADDESGGSAAS